MSSVSLEERYNDLEELCEEVDIALFKPLSWLMILNLELIPKEDVMNDNKLLFSYSLMNKETEKALEIAKRCSKADNTLAKYFLMLLEIDPDLSKTQQISYKFFAFSKRRIEFAEKHGIKAY
ncbi:MAG: hypothetical protein ACTSQE_10110 [Candidatus Heimdallarchaeaceae archaeon]